jgi:putative transposase
VLKSFKTELRPTDEQADKIRRTIGVCRYVYNLFLATNNERHKSGEKFMSGIEFSKWLNNEYVLRNQNKAWIKEVSSKSVKKSGVLPFS